MYYIIGIIISIILLIIGVIYNISNAIVGGIVFLLWNIGAMIGAHFREKKKLIPIILLVGLLAFIASLFIYSTPPLLDYYHFKLR